MDRTVSVMMVNPPSQAVEDDRVEPPLGLLYLIASLRESGYSNVGFYDMSGCQSPEAIQERIGNLPAADVFGITCLCTQFAYIRMIVSHIRTFNPNAYIVLGGPNPTAIPEYLLKGNLDIDAVVAGEGEDAFRTCVDSFARGVPRRGLIRAKPREDINSYPVPARDVADLGSYSRRLLNQPVVSMISSRGCAYRCIHCNSPVMGGGSDGARYRSADSVFAEMQSLRDAFTCFRFNDDHFTGNPDLSSLLQRIVDLGVKFRIFARIADLNEDVCKRLKQAGCVHVAVGLESLDAKNLRVLGKASQVGTEENVRTAKANGLVVRASFIVGLPHDTDASIEQYFGRAAQLGLDEFEVYPLIPYPGTQLWRAPEKFGYTIVNSDFTDYVQMGKEGRACYVLKHVGFAPEDVRRWHRTATEILESGCARHMRESEFAR